MTDVAKMRCSVNHLLFVRLEDLTKALKEAVEDISDAVEDIDLRLSALEEEVRGVAHDKPSAL